MKGIQKTETDRIKKSTSVAMADITDYSQQQDPSDPYSSARQTVENHRKLYPMELR